MVVCTPNACLSRRSCRPASSPLDEAAATMLDDAVGSVVFVDDGGGGVDGMFTTTDLTARLPFDGASEL